MNLRYAYFHNGYKESRGKDLSNDEKAYMQGIKETIGEVKCAFDNYIEDECEGTTLGKIKKETALDFVFYLEDFLEYFWAENEISFVDNSEEKPRKPNPEYKWNTEGFEVEEPEDYMLKDEYKGDNDSPDGEE